MHRLTPTPTPAAAGDAAAAGESFTLTPPKVTMEITSKMVDAALASTTPGEGPATLEETLDFSGADTARRVVKAALAAALRTTPAPPTPALLANDSPPDLQAGRYLADYQQSAVARALVKVGQLDLNLAAMLRDALARQAGALDVIRAAAAAWDATMQHEVEAALTACGLAASGAPLATPPAPALLAQLQELARLRAGATPGLWHIGSADDGCEIIAGRKWEEVCYTTNSRHAVENAAFLAAAGTLDLPAAAAAWAAAEARAAGAGWVAVGDRLPETIKNGSSTRVLCFGEGGIDGPQFVAYYAPTLNRWFLAHDNQPSMTVTHWQPLPPAPPTDAR